MSFISLAKEAPVLNLKGGNISESTLVYHDGSNSISLGFYYWAGTVWVPIGGFNNGSSGGTAITMGSNEYFVDGTHELFLQGAFHPMSHQASRFGATLGYSNYRLGSVYITNGVFTTSDMNPKQNVKDISYDLDEILQLKTISYNWKHNDKLGNTVIPPQQQERKTGFSAQQVSELIFEVVQTQSWIKTDENGN
ncbi:MAG: tail fiber domain-containing protein [Flavobacteriaceae bacterium]|nr:tail fiber domain-containing protein [Flavobacteriaceae bacterium]